MPADYPSSTPQADTPHARLLQARKAKGYASAAEAACRFGWAESTYRSHENGSRVFTRKAAERYAAAFDIDVSTLVLGAEAVSAPTARDLLQVIDELHLLRESMKDWIEPAEKSKGTDG